MTDISNSFYCFAPIYQIYHVTFGRENSLYKLFPILFRLLPSNLSFEVSSFTHI